jgi:hypothetical protein
MLNEAPALGATFYIADMTSDKICCTTQYVLKFPFSPLKTENFQ